MVRTDTVSSPPNYDAILVVAFGGPERREDVLPFLENVVRGRPVPRERLLEVAEHYYRFGGRSPLNAQTELLVEALRAELARRGPRLPVFWGNRNWHPLLPDTLRAMAEEGVQRALAFVLSAYSSYSGCRQYLENIEQARAAVGPDAPGVDKVRPCFHHPGFVDAMAERLREGLHGLAAGEGEPVKVLYAAHSIPVAMARGCLYQAQLREAARLVSARVGIEDWEVVYQSRSGPPSQPWLEPDVCDRLRQIALEGVGAVCLAPMGFLSDHMEVLYDLDIEAAEVANELGLRWVRTATVGTHPLFVRGVRDMIAERALGLPTRDYLGGVAPNPDACPAECCPRAAGPTRSRSTVAVDPE